MSLDGFVAGPVMRWIAIVNGNAITPKSHRTNAKRSMRKKHGSINNRDQHVSI
jgi:hypothetical protein